MYVFFFNHTATTEIYTLSLPDALPIYRRRSKIRSKSLRQVVPASSEASTLATMRSCSTVATIRWWKSGSSRWSVHSPSRSEEHTSELQSRQYLVCRLLLEKKKKLTQYL